MTKQVQRNSGKLLLMFFEATVLSWSTITTLLFITLCKKQTFLLAALAYMSALPKTLRGRCHSLTRFHCFSVNYQLSPVLWWLRCLARPLVGFLNQTDVFMLFSGISFMALILYAGLGWWLELDLLCRLYTLYPRLHILHHGCFHTDLHGRNERNI